LNTTPIVTSDPEADDPLELEELDVVEELELPQPASNPATIAPVSKILTSFFFIPFSFLILSFP